MKQSMVDDLNMIRARHLERSFGGGRADDDGWITVNGTHIPIDENGELKGSIGKKIQSTSSKKSGGKKSKAATQSVAKPSKPKTTRPSSKARTKIESEVLKEAGGDFFDGWGNTSIVEVPSSVSSAKDMATRLSNKFREAGYDTVFWKSNGTESTEPTTNFSIWGKNGATVEYNVSKDTDNSSKGKKYYAVESSDVY